MNEKPNEVSDLNFTLESPEYSFNGNHPGNPAIGISLSAVEAGGKVKVAHAGFYTDFDGDFFYTCLDEISRLYLQDWMTNKQQKLSKIENCLIFINKNNDFEVFINFPTLLSAVVKKDTVKGTPLFKGDFADIKEVSFPTVSFKQKCGVIYIFSHGWRRGLFFDFSPLVTDNDDIFNNYKTVFSGFHTYLMFPEIYRREEDSNFARIISDGWFPFISILGEPYDNLAKAYQNNVGIRDSNINIINSFNVEKIHDMEKRWYTKKVFENHKKIIETGVERYLAGDFISAINNIYPRIEGILRYLHLGKSGGSIPDLLETLEKAAYNKTSPNSLFLPKDFRLYLKISFFSSFDLNTGQIDLSRHALAHGVADEDQYNQVKALQGILILDQISYYV